MTQAVLNSRLRRPSRPLRLGLRPSPWLNSGRRVSSDHANWQSGAPGGAEPLSKQYSGLPAHSSASPLSVEFCAIRVVFVCKMLLWTTCLACCLVAARGVDMVSESVRCCDPGNVFEGVNEVATYLRESKRVKRLYESGDGVHKVREPGDPRGFQNPGHRNPVGRSGI